MNPDFYVRGKTAFPLYKILLSEASEAQLLKISFKLSLGLSVKEMKAVKAYFKREGRNPTDVELQTISQTWSEHCCHKTFKGKIRVGNKEINSLFETYIAKATKEINPDWCFSVFEDNAGIVRFDKGYGVAAKVETHNHPSAVEPFGGAASVLLNKAPAEVESYNDLDLKITRLFRVLQRQGQEFVERVQFVPYSE